ncbi:unnamed protein product [Schistosoma curassoni]|uniref:Endo/exonuclease/phosphatase domain-containing protein n=1 Tax=Schistosoma curassoni TaxID=6186 RepID=A0A183JVT4_9TREM|nr:unnamed protein product [Schistosoma curassoni]
MTLLISRETINIGTWNIRTMWETRKTSQIVTKMRRYNLAVLGISKTHWTDSGELLLYSGHEEGNTAHTQGVALMSKEARNGLIEWESHGFRIIKASFKTKKKIITMNVIQSYAPTNYGNDNDKDRFYKRLQSIIAKCPGKDLTMLMGDLNAKVGTENYGYEDIMRRDELREKTKAMEDLQIYVHSTK